MTQSFVYHWQEVSTNKWYIGSRTRKGCHLKDGYLTSSKYVKPLIIANPNNWKRTIIAVGNPKDMKNFEALLLKTLDAKNDPMSYNMHNGDGKFNNTGRPMSQNQKELLSKLKKGRPGHKPSKLTKQKMSEAQKNRPPITEKTRQKLIETNKTKFTDKVLKKISDAHKGKIVSQEAKEKMRIARRKGIEEGTIVPWNKGIKGYKNLNYPKNRKSKLKIEKNNGLP